MTIARSCKEIALALVTCCTVTMIAASVEAKELPVSNAFNIQGSLPAWLKINQLERIAEKMEQKLEWKLKKVSLTYYNSDPSFWQAMRVGNSQVLAFTRRSDQSIHIGPRVNSQNFEMVLSHELTHVIFMQKYQGHLPDWLEEGFANLQAGNTQLNYKLLYAQKGTPVENFAHPLRAKSTAELAFYYDGATALALMIKEKCGPIDELLNLALKDHLVKQLKTYCEIDDLNGQFWTWVGKKAAI